MSQPLPAYHGENEPRGGAGNNRPGLHAVPDARPATKREQPTPKREPADPPWMPDWWPTRDETDRQIRLEKFFEALEDYDAWHDTYGFDLAIEDDNSDFNRNLDSKWRDHTAKAEREIDDREMEL
jgi:hypothetical protein